MEPYKAGDTQTYPTGEMLFRAVINWPSPFPIKAQEKMQFAAKTDVGKLRERNEDLYYFHQQLQMFAIADGMSGHNRGDLASRIALETFQVWAETKASSESALGPIKKLEVLGELADEANQRVYTAAERQGEIRGMGTTLIAGFVAFDYMSYVHVGDSRLYVLREETFTQITTDHSLVQEMVDKGEITPEEARVHARRNIITQAVGLAPTVTADVNTYPLELGDIVLACTDGLHDLIIDDAEIADIIRTAPNIEEACENLVNTALDYGGTDNVTVLLATVD